MQCSLQRIRGPHSLSTWPKGPYQLIGSWLINLQNGILFKRGYSVDPLRCLGPKKALQAAIGTKVLLALDEKGV